MTENDLDHLSDEERFLLQIGGYKDLVLLYKLYSTRKIWGGTTFGNGAEAYKLIDAQGFPRPPERARVLETGYDYSERAASLMKYGIEHILPTVFSSDRIQHALRYTGPECIKIVPGLESHYKSHKKTPYWEMTSSQRKPLELGKMRIQLNAQKIRDAIPAHVRERLTDTDYLDLSIVEISNHEFSHAVDETIEVDSTHGKIAKSTLERSKELDSQRFSAFQNSIWASLLQRELFARGVEVYSLEYYMKKVLQLTDDEYKQFYENYYGEEFKQAEAFRMVLNYLMQTDSNFDFEELNSLKHKVQRSLRREPRLPDVGFFLAYKEKPYDIDMIKRLAGETD